MRNSGRIYVFLQFAALGYFFFVSGIFQNDIRIIFQLFGVLTGFLALWEMRKSKFSIFPELHPQSIMVQTGIYAVVRHPMYLALILIITPIVINDFTTFNVLAALLLLFAIIKKIQLEETFLSHKFQDFQKYKRHTHRLIPYLW